MLLEELLLDELDELPLEELLLEELELLLEELELLLDEEDELVGITALFFLSLPQPATKTKANKKIGDIDFI